jgi:hypothetical protein
MLWDCAVIMGIQPAVSIASSLFCFSLAAQAHAQGNGLTVDLEYGIYTDVNNSITGLTVWKRYGVILNYNLELLSTRLTSSTTESNTLLNPQDHFDGKRPRYPRQTAPL